MIFLDLCQSHYQDLLITYLITYLKRKIKSVCDFIGLQNNKLNYKFKECKERSLKPINNLIKKFLNVYQFCNEDINKFVFVVKKGCLSIQIHR